MSRMTAERALAPEPPHRINEAAILAMSDALQSVAQGMKRMQEEADTRYHALEAHVNETEQAMDAVATGLHQDSANVIMRLQVLTQWLAHTFPAFERESQALLDELVATTQTAAAALFAATPDDVPQEVDQ